MELYKLLVTIAANNAEANRAIDETGEHVNDARQDVEKFGDEGDKTQSKLGKAFSKIGSAAVAVGKVVATGLAAGVTAIAGLTKSAVEEYANYEQLVGGVETLFKDSADKVQGYAANAYKTAGMSANEYMETVTSFSAALIAGLGGDTAAAAERANLAITDMSDNANKMGSDISSIQNAYQGFAKQNYTMLDNLKLGYGGTQQEMYRLMQDAAALNDEFANTAEFSLDEKGHLVAEYSDIVTAIHIVQTEMGITGTTSKEASTTIQGSISSAKAAWSNLLVGLADDTQDFDALLTQFIDSVATVGDNLIPRIEIVLSSVTKLVSGLAPKIIEILPGLVSDIVPELISAATDLINALVAALPGIIDALSSVIPLLLEAIITITTALINALPTLISSIISFLVANIPVLIDGAFQLFFAIVDAIPLIIDAIVPEIPTIVSAIANALIDNIPTFIAAAINLYLSLVRAIPQVLGAILSAVGELVKAIMKPFEPFVDFIKDIWEKVKNAIKVAILFIGSLLKAAFDIITLPFRLIWENCKDKVFEIWDKIKEKISNVINTIKTVISTVFNSIKTIITNIITAVKTTVTNVFNAIKTAISTPLNAAKTTVSSIFDGIKTKISTVINGAKTIVSNGVNAIKGFFDKLKIKFPNIKLPHFSIKGSFSLSPPSVPKLSIDWYAKAMDNAMLLNSATIFGLNSAGQPMGGGESGQEVVAGSGTLMGMIRGAVQEENSGIVYYLERLNSMLAAYFPELLENLEKEIVLDDGTLVGKLAPKMDSKLGDINKLRARGI